eukprot:TRINITY_DN1001_c0_g2_i1.p1 TRINITY_DN1001_c0_g2~~TRINITY_DN1001_c0_g2_i1.p1  ORF type:complete len:410 (+),score=117.18 TRINITY_DN1001_c0_g2_i1:88-1230(+)
MGPVERLSAISRQVASGPPPPQLLAAAAAEAGAVIVVADPAALAAARRGDLSYGVPSGGVGNNHPERRRNIILAAALRSGATLWAPSPHPGGLALALGVHDEGMVRFLSTAWRRWRDELGGDTSYLQQPQPHPPALVPFHSSKSSRPRSDHLAAEFACYASDFETPLRADTAAALAADLSVIAGAVEKMREGARCCYAVTAHPGHHAGPTSYSGFCYVNGACVARGMLEQALGGPAALVDLDFHGGNGSYDCALELGWFFRSIHCAGAYPWVDMGPCGVELPVGTTWATGYERALRRILGELPGCTRALVVSLGFDTLATDPESTKRPNSGLGLEPRDFAAMGRMLRATGVPLLIVQEGGYDLSHIPAAFTHFLGGLGAA